MARRIIAGDLIRDHQQKYADRGTDIVLDDGTTVRVPPAQLWSNDVLTQTAKGDVVGAARALIGDEGFDALTAANITATMILGVVEEDTGLGVPE